MTIIKFASLFEWTVHCNHYADKIFVTEGKINVPLSELSHERKTFWIKHWWERRQEHIRMQELNR